MKKVFIVMIFIIFSAAVSSCDYKDIDKRMFIVTIGIDYIDEDQIEVTAKGAVAQIQTQKTEEKYAIYTVTDTTIPNALRKLKARAALEIDYSHMKNLILGQLYAENVNLEQTLSFFLGRRDLQKSIYVLVGLGDAKRYVTAPPEAILVPGSDIFMSFGQGSESVYSHEVKLKDMFSVIKTPGITNSCSVIRVGEDDIMIDQIAIFDKDKLKMVLRDDEALIFNLLYHKNISDGFIEGYDDKSKQRIGAHIKNYTKKVNITKEKDYFRCEIALDIAAEMELKPSRVEERGDITKIVEKSFKGEVERLLKKLQEAKVDPLKFEIEYWMKNLDYELSDEWLEKDIPSMVFDIKVNIQRSSRGLIK